MATLKLRISSEIRYHLPALACAKHFGKDREFWRTLRRIERLQREEAERLEMLQREEAARNELLLQEKVLRAQGAREALIEPFEDTPAGTAPFRLCLRTRREKRGNPRANEGKRNCGRKPRRSHR